MNTRNTLSLLKMVAKQQKWLEFFNYKVFISPKQAFNYKYLI